jgi:hypothetical protein
VNLTDSSAEIPEIDGDLSKNEILGAGPLADSGAGYVRLRRIEAQCFLRKTAASKPIFASVAKEI